MENISAVCPVCHQPVMPEWYFCPNCGKDLKAKPIRISVWAQVGVYTLSVLLPPLGLWPGIKYVMKDGAQAKRVGIIAIALTVISTIVTVWLTFVSFENYLNQLNQSLIGF